MRRVGAALGGGDGEGGDGGPEAKAVVTGGGCSVLLRRWEGDGRIR